MQVKPIDGGDKAYGYVVSTGFATNKGELFRSILFPRPINFRFYRDAMRFLTALTGVALAAFAKRLYDGTREGQSFGDVLINSLDLITIAGKC
jgi:cation-transporting ATPase 13A3/4/5